jgi:hypothetical protein
MHHVKLWISIMRRVILEIHSFTSCVTCVQYGSDACTKITYDKLAAVCFIMSWWHQLMSWHVVGVATPNLSVLRSNHVYMFY